MKVSERRGSRVVLALVTATMAAVSQQPTAQPADPRVIEIVAKRFAFEPSQVNVAVGERVVLSVRSADGVHGIEIKQLKVKHEIPRGGTPVSIEITPAEPGRYPILCSEYCGDGHDDMKGLLVVQATNAAQP